MTIMLLPIFVFTLGLIVGSFLNVVILRMNTGRSVAKGRSKCMHCSKEIAWYDLIPVFSYIALGGKCRACKAPISRQYALVELSTAILFVIAYITTLVHGGFTLAALLNFVFTLVVTSLLVVLTVYDIRHKIIPDTVVFSFIGLALLSIAWKAVMVPGFLVGPALFSGLIVTAPFFLLWYFSKGRLMGFGDIKFILGIGLLLGTAVATMALLFAFWTGGIVGIFLLALTPRKYSMKTQIPFGPFLALGTFLAGTWGITLTSFFRLWQ